MQPTRRIPPEETSLASEKASSSCPGGYDDGGHPDTSRFPPGPSPSFQGVQRSKVLQGQGERRARLVTRIARLAHVPTWAEGLKAWWRAEAQGLCLARAMLPAVSF